MWGRLPERREEQRIRIASQRGDSGSMLGYRIVIVKLWLSGLPLKYRVAYQGWYFGWYRLVFHWYHNSISLPDFFVVNSDHNSQRNKFVMFVLDPYGR